MTESLGALCNNLPDSGITVSVLRGLDFVVPGEWVNRTSLAQIAAHVSGEDLPKLNAEIGQRAERLFQEPGRRYQDALRLYRAVDTLDQLAAAATAVSKVSDLFGGLGFLKDIAPKPETTQALDAGLKLTVELLAYGYMQGWPEMTFDAIADFVIGLQKYAKDDVMRLSAWIVIDGLLPLGPDFMATILRTLKNTAQSGLTEHKLFGLVSSHLPGDDLQTKHAFIIQALEASSGFITGFVKDKELTPERVKSKLGSALSLVEGSGDYLAAALDASTEYFTLTGTQTVARVAAQHAYEAMRDEAWEHYVARYR